MSKKKRKNRSSRRRLNTRSSHLKGVPSAPTLPDPVDLPLGAQEPLVRLEFTAEATLQDIERATRYWTPDPEGGWVELVSALGNPSKVSAELTQVCEAYLLHCLCSGCTSPMRATSRSDAVSMAGNDLRRTSRTYLCQECHRAHKQRRAEENRARQKQAQALEQAKKDSLEEFFQQELTEPNRHSRRVGELDADMACVLMAMIDYSRVSLILPARNTLDTGWMHREFSVDIDVLRYLYLNQWIKVDRCSSFGSFTFDENGELESFYLDQVNFRLATSWEKTYQDIVAMFLAHSQNKNLNRLRNQIELMEAHSLYTYLTNLLENRYRYPPVPESKKNTLYEHIFDGLRDYTFGQMVCFLWRSADTASAWKERKQLSDAHASSATVTTLGGKIETARECKFSIPEYELPRSHDEPPALSSAHTLLRNLEEIVALDLSCELHEESLPCSPCLGMLYEGGENAEEVQDHYDILGDDGVVLRPDLATKKQIISKTK